MIIFTTIILVVPVVLWLVNWLWFRPLDKKKNLEDVGYKSMSWAEIKRVQSNRKFGRVVNPPYPNGWLVVAESRDVSKLPTKTIKIIPPFPVL